MALPAPPTDDDYIAELEAFNSSTRPKTSLVNLSYLVYCNDPTAERALSARDDREGPSAAHAGAGAETMAPTRTGGTKARVRVEPRSLEPLNTDDEGGTDVSAWFMELRARPAAGADSVAADGLRKPPLLHDVLFRKPVGAAAGAAAGAGAAAAAGGAAKAPAQFHFKRRNTETVIRGLEDGGNEALLKLFRLKSDFGGNIKQFGCRLADPDAEDATAVSTAFRALIRILNQYTRVRVHTARYRDKAVKVEFVLALECRFADRKPDDGSSPVVYADDPAGSAQCRRDSRVLVPTFLVREETLDLARTFFYRHHSYIAQGHGDGAATYRTRDARQLHKALDSLNIEGDKAPTRLRLLRVEVPASAGGSIAAAQDRLQVIDSAVMRILGDSNDWRAAGGGPNVGHHQYFPRMLVGGADGTVHRNRGRFRPLSFEFLHKKEKKALTVEARQLKYARVVGVAAEYPSDGTPKETRKEKLKQWLASVAELPPDLKDFVEQMGPVGDRGQTDLRGDVAMAELTRGTYAPYVLYKAADGVCSARILQVGDHNAVMGAAGGDYGAKQAKQDDWADADATRYGDRFTSRMMTSDDPPAQYDAGNTFVVEPQVQQLRKHLYYAATGAVDWRDDYDYALVLTRDQSSGRFVWQV